MPARGQIKSLTGEVFGRLTVLDKFKQRSVSGTGRTRRKTLWLCKCGFGGNRYKKMDGSYGFQAPHGGGLKVKMNLDNEKDFTTWWVKE